MKINVKGYIYHKESESYSDCFDRYGLNTDTNKFAISDGVTNSSFPGIWADLLISEFTLKTEKINVAETNYLKLIQSIWFDKVKQISENSSRWVTRKNFIDRRPAFATFVGLHFFNDSGNWIWEASALGDSFLFFIPEMVNNFSLDENEISVIHLSSKINFVFDNYPDYFASYGNGKGEVKTRSGLLCSGTFLLMTDALSEWFIKENGQAFEIINSWNSHSDFIRSIDKLRLENRLHNDDSAILILNISNDGKPEINYQVAHFDNISELTANEIQEEEKTGEPKAISQSETDFKSEESLESGEIIQEISSNEKTEFLVNKLEEPTNERTSEIIGISEKLYSNNINTAIPEETFLHKISKGAKDFTSSFVSLMHLGCKKNNTDMQEVTEEIKSETMPITIDNVEIENDDPDGIKKVIEDIKNEYKQKPKAENENTSNTIINKF